MADAPTAAAQLRAYEDELFGPDAPRIDGQIERGRGSFFERMTKEQHDHYAALEKLIESERRIAEAESHLAEAKDAHAQAVAMAEGSAPKAEAKPEADAAHTDETAVERSGN